MALSIAELQLFREFQEKVLALETKVQNLTARQNEDHGSLSYLKGLLKPKQETKKVD
jgi:hypothetical protein